VREIELIFTGRVRVQAQHDNCPDNGEEHKKFHVDGGLDVVTLDISNSVRQGDKMWSENYMPPFPPDVYEGGCYFNHTVKITGDDRGLVITAGVLGQRPPAFAFGWFDILAGSELAYVRRSLVYRTLSTTDPVRNGRALEIPAATVDRMADLIRQSHQKHHA
jgi:hypothetical protein